MSLKKESVNYKQVIVVNKGLKMSKGKLAAQVSHGSMSFLSWMVRNNATQYSENHYHIDFLLDGDIFNNWIDGAFTKVVLSVDDEQGLVNVINLAKQQGMVEGEDFFCIRDNCLTELTPDETGTRWTCIGFKPMDCNIINKITDGLKLYR